MAEYMAAKVAGMDVPAAVIDRIKGVEKKKQKQEGIKIAVETIQKLKEDRRASAAFTSWPSNGKTPCPRSSSRPA